MGGFLGGAGNGKGEKGKIFWQRRRVGLSEMCLLGSAWWNMGGYIVLIGGLYCFLAGLGRTENSEESALSPSRQPGPLGCWGCRFSVNQALGRLGDALLW